MQCLSSHCGSWYGAADLKHFLKTGWEAHQPFGAYDLGRCVLDKPLPSPLRSESGDVLSPPGWFEVHLPYLLDPPNKRLDQDSELLLTNHDQGTEHGV